MFTDLVWSPASCSAFKKTGDTLQGVLKYWCQVLRIPMKTGLSISRLLQLVPRLEFAVLPVCPQGGEESHQKKKNLAYLILICFRKCTHTQISVSTYENSFVNLVTISLCKYI